ncbi:MAG: beta-lactamase family protein [Clostridia bacterium]|nr:beta-lactamase family protein [Clostridia bacterium]MBQ8552538.1 beta-lactamase family protein [Clostridia bacterium]
MDFSNLKAFLDHMAANRTPGCAVAVMLDGKLVYKYAAGVSDLDAKAPMTGEEYFNIYSCSKVTTVTAGAQLVEKGILDLNDPLYDYIPEYRQMYVKTKDGDIIKAKNPIKVGDLFSMTAGFNYNWNAPSIKKLREEKNNLHTTADFVRALANEPLDFEPGTHWRYSLCHDALGGLISIVTGKPFGEYVKENIFDPLGMTESVYHHTPEVEARMASQYKFVTDDPAQLGLSIVEAQIRGSGNVGHFENVGIAISSGHGGYPAFESGGAGITTTVGDYVKLMAALSRGGLGANGERILASKTVELIKTNRLSDDLLRDFNWRHLRGYGYGLGMRTHISRGGSGSLSPLGEFGWGGAAGANVLMDTESKLGLFFVQHTLNPREEWYQPRLRNVVYSCLD